MRREILGGLTSLLIPFAAYAAPSSYGAYQARRNAATVDRQLPPPRLKETPPDSKQFTGSDADLAITAGSPVRELVIIDAAVPDKILLQSATRPGVETLVLQSGTDALAQTTALLKNYHNLEAVHLVSHGQAGTLLLGGQRIDKDTLERQPQFLSALDHATRAGADLLLYGCDLAGEDSGLLEVIHNNSHLDVAASDNLTGAAELGGDWTLEITAGTIETGRPFSDRALTDFSAVLRPSGTQIFEGVGAQYYQDDPSIDWDEFTTYINSEATNSEILSSGVNTTCDDGPGDGLYVSMFHAGSRFSLRSDPSGELFGISGLNIRTGSAEYGADTITITGYNASDTIVGTKGPVTLGADTPTGTAIDLTAGITGSFAGIVRFRIAATSSVAPNDERDFCLVSVDFTSLDSDGELTPAGDVTEPVALGTTVDTAAEAEGVFDFTLKDGGGGDGNPLLASAITVHASGTSTDSERGKITWRLSGPDSADVVGTYNAATDTITFSALSLSIADGGSETYTINAFYNDNTGLTDGHTIVLSVDGDTDLAIDGSGTGMSGSNAAVNNGTGTTIDVEATQLAFATQPADSVSGNALATQPVIAARDAFGNTDTDFSETITLTQDGAGSLTGNALVAVGGVASFTALEYTATADQETFTLTANDEDGVGSNLASVSAGALTADVVATKLLFTTQPAPTSVASGMLTDFTSDPVVRAVDADDTLDTGYASDITLQANGPGSAVITATGDTDGAANTVTFTPGGGVSSFAGLAINYTTSGSTNETFTLRATSGALANADSNLLTAIANQPPTDIALNSLDVNQSGGTNTQVGTLSSTDADAADSHSYSLVAGTGDTDNGSFNISGNQLRANDASALAAGTYSVRVQTQDSAGGTYAEAFTITVVDDIAPLVESVSVPTAGTYTVGQNLDFTVNTSENVAVTGTPRIPVTIGSAAVYADYVSGSGTSVLTFRYAIQAEDSDSDGIAAGGAIDFNGGTIDDAASNDLGASLNNIGSTAGVLVDAVAPAGHSVNFDDDALNGTEAVSVSFTFAAAEAGANFNYSISSSGGGMPVTGSGTVASAGEQIAGIDVSGLPDGTLTLSTTLTDSAGNSAGAVTDTAIMDTVGPAAASVTLPADATYGTGQSLDFSVNFDEAVTVGGGIPRLALTIGASARYADYISGSGTQTLLFRYNVQNGDNDSDGIALNTLLDANGGTLRDSVGNGADNNLAPIDSLAAVLVDTQAASVTSVTPPADNIYQPGETLDFTVNYDEVIAVSGTPRLQLTVGSSTRYATYVAGSGSNALQFHYTVLSGDRDGDGVELSATLDTNGGTLRDTTGNDANIGLNAVGSLTGVLVDDGLDSDGDGVSDVQEGIDGTDPNDADDYLDNTPPVVTAPADLLFDATGLFTPVTLRQLLQLPANATEEQVQQARDALASDAIDGADCCDTRAASIASNSGNPRSIDSDNTLWLAPGTHTVDWQGEDRKGNTGTDVQTLEIRPLVSLGRDQIGVEGGPVSLRVYLNGPAPSYPLDAPYSIATSGTADTADHDLVDGNATFGSGQLQLSLPVNLTGGDAIEGNETLVVDLDGGALNSGANTRHTVTITEGNVPPVVSLELQQNAIDTALVTGGGGNVTVTANVSDPNTADTHNYNWAGTSPNLTDTDGDPADDGFVFDPATLAPGVYTLRAFVIDSNGASDTAELSFRLATAAPLLDGLTDSDGDDLDDLSEGFGDSDGDGIPDYLDNIAAGNVLPLAAGVTDAFLIECEPGLLCRRGRYALAGADGGAAIREDALPADPGFNHAGGLFDFEVHGLPIPGRTVRVAIPLAEAIPAGAVYRKFDGQLWFPFVEDNNNALHSSAGDVGFCPPPGDAAWQPGLVEGYHCLQLTLEDGGPNDSDSLANGSLLDPGGLAVAAGSSSSSGGSSSSASSSGGSSSSSSSSGSSSSSSSGGQHAGSGSVNGRNKGGGALELPTLLALLLLVLWRNRRRAVRLVSPE
ncbi:DUF4347 domain-containing protein [Microbulbifer litoralis]|uniref:DUF4347 domain-containing protein n=1 Tax=Microbulbifer litoralis TaxID=2933965 RepID=UPI002028CF73|nr:DUF4347 domain-containing protein [Microbulbifer sp. GX H0434]